MNSEEKAKQILKRYDGEIFAVHKKIDRLRVYTQQFGWLFPVEWNNGIKEQNEHRYRAEHQNNSESLFASDPVYAKLSGLEKNPVWEKLKKDPSFYNNSHRYRENVSHVQRLLSHLKLRMKSRSMNEETYISIQDGSHEIYQRLKQIKGFTEGETERKTIEDRLKSMDDALRKKLIDYSTEKGSLYDSISNIGEIFVGKEYQQMLAGTHPVYENFMNHIHENALVENEERQRTEAEKRKGLELEVLNIENKKPVPNLLDRVKETYQAIFS